MIVGEIWRYIPHGKKSYFPRPVPKGNVIFLGESSYLPNVHPISCLLYQTTGDNFNTFGSIWFSIFAKQKCSEWFLSVSFLI